MTFLTSYAIDNFWCNPKQAKQSIYNLARLTPVQGAMNTYQVLLRTIALPSVGPDVYHIFSVGQINPTLLNIITQEPDWVYQSWSTMSSAMNSSNLFVDIYNSNGIHVPRFDVYYRVTTTRDLIIAIKQNSNIPINYETDAVYLRLYSNAWYNETANAGISLYTEGKTYTNVNDILTLQTDYNTYAAKTGAVYCYVNGYLVDAIDLINISVGDSAEFIYDASIKNVITLPVSNLQVFTSILDSKNKYLVHYSTVQENTIDYVGDIDIYIVNPFATNKYKGVYYHKNAIDSYRQVTHKDYAICVDYYDVIATSFQTAVGIATIPDINNLNLMIYIRNSGYNHSLVHENNRVNELYKMSDENVMGALVGINSTVNVWSAPQLENSTYVQVMSSKITDINDLLIQTALGYNAYSKLVADTPSIVTTNSGQLIASVPTGLQTSYTSFEYDVNGSLLGIYAGEVGNTYNVVNASCTQVEMMYGSFSSNPDVYFGTTTVDIPLNCNYRVYLNTIANGVIGPTWTDITGTSQYSYANGVVTWTGNTTNSSYLMVRTDRTILVNQYSILPQDGIISFSFEETGMMHGSPATTYVMPVPMGDMEILLNGKSLVEGIDFIVNWPVICINNKTALVQPASTTYQNVTVRWSGFCDSSLNYRKYTDSGFIADNSFSNDYRYDVMDDSVNRIVVGGKYITRATLGIVDTTAGVAVNSGYNGLPYSIKKPLIPIQNLISTDLLSYNSASVSIDTEVQNYLSTYLTKLTETVTPIPQLYQVISPFITKILWMLVNKEVDVSGITSTMTDNEILAWCKPYESWLQFDPIYNTNQLDPRFVVIVPVNINNTLSLPVVLYSFMMSVVRLYANGLINLASYLNITPI